MRGHLIVVVTLALAACGRSHDKPRPPLSAQAPTVADAKALLAESVAPPAVLVIVAPDGSLSVADAPDAPVAGERWARLDQPPPRAPVAVDRQALPHLIGEATALNAKIEPSAKQLAARGAPPAPVRAKDAAAIDDDPPPPPEEEPADDGADESGGTGTWVMLEEGKMGKKDSDRPAGRSELKRAGDDPQLAQAALVRDAERRPVDGGEQVDDRRGLGGGRGDHQRARPVADAVVRGARQERRADRQVGIRVVDGGGARRGHVGAAGSRTEDAGLAGGADRLRALRVGFGLLHDVSTTPVMQPWVEVRVGARELTVEAVPSPAVTIPFVAAGALDTAALAAAYTAARASLGDAERRDVDVLVGPDTDVQRLVDVIAALDGAGAMLVSLGHMPPAAELAKRGKRIPRALVGQPQSVGGLDKQIIRSRVKTELPKIKACYEQALAADPALTGTVRTQFFISPNGLVADSNASGVDPAVAACVAAVIKAIEFPKPAGGGGVQVNYPFTFRN